MNTTPAEIQTWSVMDGHVLFALVSNLVDLGVEEERAMEILYEAYSLGTKASDRIWKREINGV
jgi:hypothetical protein